MGRIHPIRQSLETVLQHLHFEGIPQSGSKVIPAQRQVDTLHRHHQLLSRTSSSPICTQLHTTTGRNGRPQ
jgi:hypothetical protein